MNKQQHQPSPRTEIEHSKDKLQIIKIESDLRDDPGRLQQTDALSRCTTLQIFDSPTGTSYEKYQELLMILSQHTQNGPTQTKHEAFKRNERLLCDQR